MKKLFWLILLLTASLQAQSPPAFMSVSASHIYGTGGTLLPAGTTIWQAVDSNGNPVGYQVNGGGQQITYPTVCSVVSGAITGGCMLPNVSVTNPMNVCFAVTIKDANNQIVSPPSNGYSCVQPQTTNSWCSSGACNFDAYAPNNPSVITAQLATPQTLSLGGLYAQSCPSGQVVNGVLVGTGTFSCGSGSGGIVGVVTATGSGLSGGASTGTPALAMAPCPNGQTQISNGTTYACGSVSSGGGVWGSITGTLSSQSDLWSYLQSLAPLNSPSFAGTPTVPTPSTNDNSTKVANTAWVNAQGYSTGSGNVTGPGTSTANDVAVFNSTTGKVIADSSIQISAMALLDSPTFTGNPNAPTQSTSDNSTKLATTAFVKAQGYAPLASPSFMGTVSGITATMVGLGNVANTAQAWASIYPNSAPSSAQIPVGNSGGTGYVAQTASGDCSLSNSGVFTCTKSNGTTFGTAAFGTLGTSPNNVVQLTSSGFLPAVNGSLLTNILAVAFSSTPTSCSGSQFATGIGSNGNAICGTPSGTGNVNNVGTPASGQLAEWTGPTTIQGVNTLPHSQLPTLLSADIPNNAANTSGTAGGLSANIAESQVTNLTTDLGNRALTSTTVNGHALSSNVVVSASDITTGTLPHAQLPALLSGDIPNNAANTTGTANSANSLAATPTTCSGSQFATGVAANGNAICGTPTGSGTLNPTGTPTSGQLAEWTGGTTLQGVNTLPHAQLPTLLSGDIPNNAANTTGTAAGLTSAYIDWNAVSGGAFIQNKPTIPVASSTTPLMDGTAAIGSSATYARADHVHPSDTSRVSTSTTVNGHSLSSNVTVSASDITTGTLPHAQLPALVSGDIPNNAANTSGTAGTATALAATPTQCTGSQVATGVTATGNANCTSASTGTVTSSGSPASGNVPKFTTGTNIAPSALNDNGTTVSSTEPFAVNATTLANAIVFTQNSNALPTVTSGQSVIASDTSANGGVLRFNVNNTGWIPFLTSVTNTGTSGAANWNSTTGVLNIPNYATYVGTVQTKTGSSTYTVTSTDFQNSNIIYLSPTYSASALTLPSTAPPNGQYITVVSLSGTNMSISAGGTLTINGVTSASLWPTNRTTSASTSAIIISDGTNYEAVAPGTMQAITPGTGLQSLPFGGSLGTNNIYTTGTLSLAQISADSLLLNNSGSTAVPNAIPMPTTGTNGCAGANNALTYNTSTHTLGCNSISGGGGTTTNALTLNNSGSGAASGSTFNGASAITLSYNTIGAQPTLTGTGLARNTGASAEISGDCTTSGSNAITCTKTNGTAFGTGATATIANYLALAGGTMTGAITFAGGQTWPTFNQNTTGTAANLTAAASLPAGTTLNGGAFYTLPTATSSTLGGVKPDGTTITNSSGAISCTTATTSQLGCVKPDGSSITISGGVISSTGGTSNWYAAGTDSGSGTAYVVTSTMTSYAVGNAQCFIANTSNTSSNPTVNFNSLGAKTIVRAMPVNGVLTFSGSADIKATNLTCLVYDGTNFDLLNPQAATGTGKIVQSGSPTIVTPSLTTPSIGATAITETFTASTAGVTANLLAGFDGTTGNVTTIAAGANGAIGPAQTTQTSGQSVELAIEGLTTCIADNTVAVGDLLVTGTTTAGRCKDSGQTTDAGISSALQIIGKAKTSGSAGASITYNTAGPGHYGLIPSAIPSSPTSNGFYSVGYNVTASAAVSLTASLLGFRGRAVTGTTSTDTILYSDNLLPVMYQGSVAVAVTLPTASTLGNTGFGTTLTNNTSGSATAVTVTPTTWTVNGASSLVIAQGQECKIFADPSGTNWDADCHDLPLSAGSNITITRGQYGPTIAASGSTGVSSVGLTINGGSSSGAAAVTGSPVTSSGTLNINFTGTNGHLMGFGSSNSPIDTGVVTANVVLASSPGAGICHFAGSTQTCTSSAVVGSDMTSNTVTATQLATQYSKGQCTEVWGGSGTSNALSTGDDSISNNSCYNDSGVTRTITAVKCRSDIASNTTTVNPTFGSAGTGTTILSGTLTCGSSYAYSSTGSISNASWPTGTGIDPAMGGTLTGTSIALLIDYTY